MRYNSCGVTCENYYLTLRCNLSIIMGDSKYLLLDMDKYSSNEIIKQMNKRLFEINEFRHVRLHLSSIESFKVERADIAIDIIHKFPEIIVYLCNMSFPYHHCNMIRKPIKKEREILNKESCCFANQLRGFNIYSKWRAIINCNKNVKISYEERKQLKQTVRIEIQIMKKHILNSKLKFPDQRRINPFLDKNFCHDYLKKEILPVFGLQKYVSRSKAIKIIQESLYSDYIKEVMISIIDMILEFGGMYELEKAIEDKNTYTPSNYGNLRTFRECWLKKIRSLGIQPVVIPDSFEIDEIPSIYALLTSEKGSN